MNETLFNFYIFSWYFQIFTLLLIVCLIIYKNNFSFIFPNILFSINLIITFILELYGFYLYNNKLNNSQLGQFYCINNFSLLVPFYLIITFKNLKLKWVIIIVFMLLFFSFILYNIPFILHQEIIAAFMQNLILIFLGLLLISQIFLKSILKILVFQKIALIVFFMILLGSIIDIALYYIIKLPDLYFYSLQLLKNIFSDIGYIIIFYLLLIEKKYCVNYFRQI